MSSPMTASFVSICVWFSLNRCLLFGDFFDQWGEQGIVAAGFDRDKGGNKPRREGNRNQSEA